MKYDKEKIFKRGKEIGNAKKENKLLEMGALI